MTSCPLLCCEESCISKGCSTHISGGLTESASPTGSIVVEGHELHEEDIRLMYAFDQTTSGTAQFEAHSDAQVFICSIESSCKEMRT